MLVCPQCQFENPNNHRFCQKCGTSLTNQPCSQCSTSVSFTTEVCPNCGAKTGIRWRVSVVEPVTEGDSSQSEAEKRRINPNYGSFLDVGQRYRVLIQDEEIGLVESDLQGQYRFYEGTVIDSQPLQKSVLKSFFREETSVPQSQSEDDDQPENVWYQIGIPKLAIPYLKLRELVPIIPEIYDAWQENEQEYLILRENSSELSIFQQMAEEPLPLLQIIYWLTQIANLWIELAPLESCQSLLIEDNLGIDENQRVFLRQIYPNTPEKPLNIEELGKMWQKWLSSSLQCPSESLNALIEDVTEGRLLEIEQLYLKLEELAEKEQKKSMMEELPGEALDIEDLPEVLREQLAEAEARHAISSIDSLDDSPITNAPQMILTAIGEGDDGRTAILPMKLLSLHDAGLTDTGRQRRHNEDFFSMKTQLNQQQNNHARKLKAKGLYIVCDGMGGHAAGEVASAMAVETLTHYFQTHWEEGLPSQEIVQEGILLANHTLYEVNQQNASLGSGRMGTTLVLALLQDTDVVIAHVGDSRVYRVNRKWGLEQLTVDHEVGQRAIQGGVEPEIAYARPDAYQLTQALGPHDNDYVKPDIRYLHIQEDTLLLLCSDGLSDNNLIEDHWESHLQPLISASQNLDIGLQKLITLANQKNGHDNITAILVRIKVRPDQDQQRIGKQLTVRFWVDT